MNTQMNCHNCNIPLTNTKKFCSKKCCGQSKKKASLLSDGRRVCSSCKTAKDLDEFHVITQNNKQKTYTYCKDCYRKKDKESSTSPHGRWVRSKYKANRTGTVWSIPELIYENLLENKCHYCDGDLCKSGVGLDRTNNDLGYIIENVVPCCKRCNVVKGDYFSYEEMMLLRPVLLSIRLTRISDC